MPRVHPAHLVILILALIGFLHQLIVNPINLLITGGFLLLIIWLLNNYMKTGRFLPPRNKKIQRGTPQVKHYSQASKHHREAKSRPNPFQVIEGKKGKDKTKEK